MTSLVPAASPLEAAVESVVAHRYDLPAGAITASWSPRDCPLEMLGFLAWQLSIDLWDDAWPELKKRQVCANAIALHRSKTTLAGIKAHVALIGSTILKATRPPGRGFLRGAMTDAQRAAWLESLPQIRLYPFLATPIAVRREFASGPAGRFFHDQGFLRANRGLDLAYTRATYFDRGEERDIAFEPGADGVVRLMVPRRVRRGWHGAGFGGAGWLTHSQAERGVFTVRVSDDAAGFAIEAGLDPVDVRPTRIAQPRIAPAARSFFGPRRRARFLLPTYAPWLIYDRVSLHAADRMGARRRTRSFHGHGRFGVAPFTAELQISVPLHRAPRRGGRWHGVGFRAAADLTPLARTLEAIRVSKAMRDTILVDTTTQRPVRFGDGLDFGSFDFGEIRKVA